jgi:Collagen triple helix repeat (20 copies)
MMRRTIRSLQTQGRRRGSALSILLAASAVFIVLGGSAVAATGLIRAAQIAPGAVTSTAIRNGTVAASDLSPGTLALLEGGQGAAGGKGDTGAAGNAGAKGDTGTVGTAGAKGDTGTTGSTGAKGDTGTTGNAGAKGDTGTTGTAGSNGANGPNGANGAGGANGANGANGVDGRAGADGAPGVQGAPGPQGPIGVAGPQGAPGTNGTIAPLSAKQGLTVLPTGNPGTTVVELAVPAGNYVVLAKTQLYQSGAGDSVECLLKSGTTTLDQTAMKTLPALASVPASMQAVTTAAASPTTLSVQCKVSVADGTANYNSLIAIPTA